MDGKMSFTNYLPWNDIWKTSILILINIRACQYVKSKDSLMLLSPSIDVGEKVYEISF